ncbi:hypothetical protein [Pontimicrobium aquaticum]|uniref:Uncharacterized protein n=1 Tax=Pontimicrobium aquaticum TaxID=2565367 RepID=A0A4U0ENB4_9FLAO|nr:hypothetical protein [Pontimicrobium aquaticum]TJY32524.1 hypothetical protein E5167_14265 [Pontimicrobium aquaticum]
MQKKSLKKTIILSVLFFLPVMFLLFLYPSKHNYNPLDTVKTNVVDVANFKDEDGNIVSFKDNITVVGFLGSEALKQTTTALNLKELIYDKFKGFKRFQILILVPNGAQDQVTELRKELLKYDELKYWHFAYGQPKNVLNVFNSLKSTTQLDGNYATSHVFIVDNELNQRGRIDDRTENEVETNKSIYSLNSYNCVEVAELKNKMSEDIRILFTEYRQKRKGNFDSSSRRADDIKINEKN